MTSTDAARYDQNVDKARAHMSLTDTASIKSFYADISAGDNAYAAAYGRLQAITNELLGIVDRQTAEITRLTVPVDGDGHCAAGAYCTGGHVDA